MALTLVACAAPATSGTPATATPSSPVVASAVTSSAPSAVPTEPASPEASSEPLAWTRLDVSGPTAREDHTWTLDDAGDTAYLFGGRAGTEALGDLWAYDLAANSWSPVQADGAPAPRFGHEAVWADGIGLVVFAGQSGPAFFNDLWAFDPVTRAWRELPSTGDVPVARYGTCASIGPDGRLWISHGFTSDGTRFADTKAYDLADGTWTDETPSGDLPVNRCLHGCWWTDDGGLTLFGGQTTGVTALDDRWILRPGARWSSVDGVAPTARNLYARARLDGATLLFGGQALDGGRLDDAWILVDGEADATRLEVAGSPPGRSGAEMVLDSGRGRVLLFGGLGSEGPLADTWQLTGSLPTGR